MHILELIDSEFKQQIIHDFLSILNRDAFEESPIFFFNYKKEMAPKTLSEKIFCFIEGNIGIGKSTFLANFVHSKYPIIEEPLKLWSNIKDKKTQKNCLEIYFSEMEISERNSIGYSNFITKFSFICLFTQLFYLFTSIEENQEDTIFFSERSIASEK